jgi:predicted nucleotidyltransferase
VAKKTTPDFRAILRTLRKHRVDFVVVGGVGAALQGAPINTFDLDVVHSRQPGNVERLLEALEALKARYRTPGGENLRPQHSHLASGGHQLLMTEAGPLDLLGTIGEGHGYDDLVAQTTEMDLGEDVKARVLDLATLIRIKAETAQEKDKLALMILRRTLEERNRK